MSCFSKTDVKIINYKGQNGNEFTDLSLHLMGEDFFGYYTIMENDLPYKDGEVRGKIKGDTLVGDYYYRPYGDAYNKRVAIAFLMQDDSILIPGKGVASIYMSIP